MEVGLARFGTYDFNSAIPYLSMAREQSEPGGADWIKASYALALSRWHASPPSSHEIDEATRLLEELLASDAKERFPEGMEAQISIDLARIVEVQDFPGDPVDVEGARDRYRKVMEEYPDTPEAYQAALRLANSHLKEQSRESAEKALSILREFMDGNEEIPYWPSLVYQEIGDIESLWNADFKAALTAYEQALSRGILNSVKEDEFVWKTARLAAETGNMEKARDYYSMIVSNYPRSVWKTLARKRANELGANLPEPSPDKTSRASIHQYGGKEYRQ